MGGKRKKLSGNKADELADVVLEKLGAKLKQIGIVKAGEFGKDKFIRETGIERGPYHDVKKKMGFFKMLRSRPDLFLLFDVVGDPTNVEQLWLRAPCSPPAHNPNAEPCSGFQSVCYCNRGRSCKLRHDPVDWVRNHGGIAASESTDLCDVAQPPPKRQDTTQDLT